jgi:anti-anti-sigma factor
MDRFDMDAVPDGELCTLILTGEADLMAAPDLTALGVAALAEAATRTVTIDVRAVTFIDAACLGALIAICDAAEEFGKRVILEAVPPGYSESSR